MKNLNYIDRSEEWYNLKYNRTFRFYIKAIKPNFNSTRLLVKKVWTENETAIIYLVNPERLKKENLRIETYDFERSSIFYNLANSGFRKFIIVDNLGNHLYEFKVRYTNIYMENGDSCESVKFQGNRL